MDTAFLVTGLVLGALASWMITHNYYRRSSADQKRLYEKLSAEVRDAILDDSRESLSVRELNQLLDDKTVDSEAVDAPLPFKACPKCGSQELDRRDVTDYEHDEMYFYIECKQCKWGEWTQ